MMGVRRQFALPIINRYQQLNNSQQLSTAQQLNSSTTLQLNS